MCACFNDVKAPIGYTRSHVPNVIENQKRLLFTGQKSIDEENHLNLPAHD